MLKLTLILIYIFTIFFISIIYKKYYPNNREVLRKIIHIGIGPLIPFAKYLDISKTSALNFTGVITLLIFLNYLYKLFPTIEDVDRRSFGTLFYCISLFVLINLFWDQDPTSLIAGFFIMTFGDGLAGLIGKNFHSKNWTIFQQKKSFLGTITMFFTSLIIVFSLGYLGDYDLNIKFFLIALIATSVEQISIVGIDNFIVPITASLCFNHFITGL